MKLNVKTTLRIGIIFFYISLFWQVYDSVVSKILNNVFLLGDTQRGIIMALDNIVAIVLLPVFGTLSDKTKSKLGKRTPYIIIGTVLSSIFIVLLGVATSSKSLTFFMTILCFLLVFMAFYRSPAVALMPDLTLKPLRTKGNLLINFMGGLGNLLALILVAFLLKESSDYIPLFSTVSIIMLFSMGYFLLVINEPNLLEKRKSDELIFATDEEDVVVDDKTESNEEKKERLVSTIFLLIAVFMWFMAFNAMTTSFSLFAEQVWKIEGGKFTVPMIFSFIAAGLLVVPVLILGKKFHRKTMILIGIIEMIVAFFLIFLFGSNINGEVIDFSNKMFNNFYFYLVTFLIGLCYSGWALININSYPMVVEMCLNSTVGKYTGYYYTASMAAQIVTPFLSGMLIEVFSMKILFLYGAVFSIISFFAMCRVLRGNVKPLKEYLKKWRKGGE